MIQRVQSVWLLLTSLTLFVLLALPIVSTLDKGTEFSIYAHGLHHKAVTAGSELIVDLFLPLIIFTAAVALLSLVNIFMFRNRLLQKRICIMIILGILALGVWIGWMASEIPGGLENASYKAGTFLPLLALIFCILALRGIRKDEQLIRSADRLR